MIDTVHLNDFQANLVAVAEIAIVSPQENSLIEVVQDYSETQLGYLDLVHHQFVLIHQVASNYYNSILDQQQSQPKQNYNHEFFFDYLFNRTRSATEIQTHINHAYHLKKWENSRYRRVYEGTLGEPNANHEGGAAVADVDYIEGDTCHIIQFLSILVGVPGDEQAHYHYDVDQAHHMTVSSDV